MAFSTGFSRSTISTILHLQINRLSSIPSVRFSSIPHPDDVHTKYLQYPQSDPAAAELLANRKASSTRNMSFGDPIAYAGVHKDHNEILRIAYCVRVRDEYVDKLLNYVKF